MTWSNWAGNQTMTAAWLVAALLLVHQNSDGSRLSRLGSVTELPGSSRTVESSSAALEPRVRVDALEPGEVGNVAGARRALRRL